MNRTISSWQRSPRPRRHPRCPQSAIGVTVAVMIVSLAAASGCGVRPQVEVQAVEVVQTTPRASRLQIVLMLTNDSDEALPLITAGGSVSLGELGRFEFEDDPARTVPGIGNTGRIQFAVPLAVDQPAEELLGARYRVDGSVSYEPPDTWRQLLNQSGAPKPRVSFSGRGTVTSAPDAASRSSEAR